YRQLGRFLALENPRNVAAGLPVRIALARAVAHQAAVKNTLAHAETRRQRMASRQRGQPLPMPGPEPAAPDEQRARAVLDGGCNGRFDVALAADLEDEQALPYRLRGGRKVPSLRLALGTVPVHQRGDRRLGHDLLQQLQALCSQLGGQE